MIPELRTSLYTYLTSGGNPFITLLGAGNLKHKHVKNNRDYPYCVFMQVDQTRTIDSGVKLIDVEVVFMTYDGSNDGVKESSISASNVEATVQALDAMLDNQDKAFTLTGGYLLRSIKQITIGNTFELSNSVHGVLSTYLIKIQKVR